MRIALGLSLLLALSACSIFNKPDPGHLDANVGLDMGPMDGGVDDGGPDAWIVDAGQDASMCVGHLEVCNNGIDDDCDGLRDCADPDCLTAMASVCCSSAGTTTTTEHFEAPGSVWSTIGNWSTQPSMAAAIVGGMNGRLIDMGTGAPIGMVNNTCLHVDLGTQIRFTMAAQPCSAAACAGEMEVVVGPSAMFSGMLTDDVAIRGVSMNGSLVVSIVQGGTVRRTSTLPFGALTTLVTVDLAPGVASGRPAIVASVTLTQGSMFESLTAMTGPLYVTDRNIFGTSSCPGLHLGVQGTGDDVALDDVSIYQLDCSNPARFDHVSGDSVTLDAITMSVRQDTPTLAGWGRGGIGDPALYEGVYSGTGDQHRFTLLFDGSPVDRASDVIGHLPLSIGGADILAPGSGPTSLAVLSNDCHRWVPRGLGNTVCAPQAMANGHAVVDATPRAMRDPALYPTYGTGNRISNYLVAWVGESAPGSALGLYQASMSADPITPQIGVATATTIHGDESCPSLRNPLLLPYLQGTEDWLLFYVCDTFPPVVHAATLSGPTATRIPNFELGPTELGSLARQGVTDIAGVVFDYVDASSVHTPTYRLWLTTRPTTTHTAVLFVEGTAPRDSAPGTFPVFVPFAGNPVLEETSAVFDSCGLGCQLHGITATRISNDPTQVRLLVERWVDTGSGLTYGLIPLSQLWPTDH